MPLNPTKPNQTKFLQSEQIFFSPLYNTFTHCTNILGCFHGIKAYFKLKGDIFQFNLHCTFICVAFNEHIGYNN